jgi:hypothetical protein
VVATARRRRNRPKSVVSELDQSLGINSYVHWQQSLDCIYEPEKIGAYSWWSDYYRCREMFVKCQDVTRACARVTITNMILLSNSEGVLCSVVQRSPLWDRARVRGRGPEPHG